eukprot:9162190-Pyramimonas_sp.AAC.1
MDQARLQNRRAARIERDLLGPAFRPKDRPWPQRPPRPGRPLVLGRILGPLDVQQIPEKLNAGILKLGLRQLTSLLTG